MGYTTELEIGFLDGSNYLWPSCRQQVKEHLLETIAADNLAEQIADDILEAFDTQDRTDVCIEAWYIKRLFDQIDDWPEELGFTLRACGEVPTDTWIAVYMKGTRTFSQGPWNEEEILPPGADAATPSPQDTERPLPLAKPRG